MKKITHSKLTLRTDTLRTLTDAALAGVLGGQRTDYSNSNLTCQRSCPPDFTQSCNVSCADGCTV